MNDHADELTRIARGWDEAAAGYEAYFVPRFAPWVDSTVDAITATPLPDGPILVPCCGTFPELPALLRHFPNRDIIGIDLSPGMVRLARDRAAAWPHVTILEADASTLDPHFHAQCAAVVSVFGLQQLPDPTHAIRSWTLALAPAAPLAVTFWPHTTETTGPFALIAQLVRSHVPPSDHSWEDQLTPTLTAAGATLERDEPLTHPMSHPDAPTFFTAVTNSGPLRPLATTRGEAFISQLRNDFLQAAPPGPLTHHPPARLILARR